MLPPHPYRVHRELQRTETEVHGRKIPLLDLREKLLRKLEPFMHLRTDEEISSLRRHEILHVYKERNLQLPADLSVESLRANLKNSERTRTIGIWHDQAAILGKGYILVTAKVFYD